MPTPSPAPSTSAASSSSASSSNSPQTQTQTQKQAQKQDQHDLPRCHSCRKRRVRCDATRPACQKCRAKNIVCPGYARQKPLVWLADGGRQNEYIRAEAQEGSVRGGRKKGRPKMVQAPPCRQEAQEEGNAASKKQEEAQEKERPESESEDEKSRELVVAVRGIEYTTNPRYIRVCLPKSLDLLYPQSVKDLVNALKYFDERLFPDIHPIAYHETVHALDPKLWQDFLNLVIWDVLISVVMTHKTIQSLPPRQLTDSRQPHNGDCSNTLSNTEERIELRREVYEYKSRAYRVLNQELRKPETQLSDVTLLCVLTLLLAETQVSARGDWWTHFQGGHRIIKLRGGLGKIVEANPFIGSQIKYFMLMDVMSGTTIDVLPLEDAERALEYRPLIPSFFCNGRETWLPCPDDMFDAIIRINHIHAKVQAGHYTNSSGISSNNNNRSNSTGDDAAAFKSTVRELIQSILSFSVCAWATERAAEYDANANIRPEFAEKRRFILPAWDDWLRIGGAYHSAVLLYCIRCLALDFGDDELFCVSPTSGVSAQQLQPQQAPLIPREIDPEGEDATAAALPIYVTVHDIQLVAKQALTDHLSTVLTPPPSSPKHQSPRRKPQPLGKVLTWPIFIAGVEAAVDTSAIDNYLNNSPPFPSSSPSPSLSSPSSFFSSSAPHIPNENLDLVCNSLLRIARDLGTLGQHDSIALLQREWQQTCKRHMQRQQLRQEPLQQQVQQLALTGEKRWWSEIFAKLKGRHCCFM